MAKQTQKSQTKEETPSEVTFTMTTRDSIPTIARAGRTSKYAPLYEAAKKLTGEQTISLPIAKYSQVQAFKPKLEDMGLVVSVRKTDKGLSAFISLPVEEEKS